MEVSKSGSGTGKTLGFASKKLNVVRSKYFATVLLWSGKGCKPIITSPHPGPPLKTGEGVCLNTIFRIFEIYRI